MSMPKKKAWATGLVAASITCSIVWSAGAQSDRVQRIRSTEEIFAAWNHPHTPGCAIGVVRGGEMLYKVGYGSANLDYDVPLTSESVFYIASTSKQFTAASIALLVLDGNVSLDDDIRKYVPEIPVYEWPITVRHLVHHTSGLRDYLTLRGLAGESFEDFFDIDWGIDLLSRQGALNFEPGSEYLYSNSGYLLLAEIVQRSSGRSMQEYSHEKFFGPLGMDATEWGGDRQKVIANRVISYDRRERGDYRRWVRNFHAMGDGNLLTTVDDLLKWDEMFYDDSPEAQRLHALQLEHGELNDGEELPYAFGLVHGTYRDDPIVSHGGAFLGFRTELLRFPQQHFSAVVLCNFGTANPGAYARRLADVWLFEDDGPAGAEESEWVTEAETIDLPQEKLAPFAGVYRSQSSPFGDLIVSLGETGLTAELAGLTLTLAAIGPGTFRTMDSPIDGRFEFKTEGREDVVTLRTPQQEEMTMTRVDLATAAEEEIGDLVGVYYSSELDAAYEMTLSNDTLQVHRPGGTTTPLRLVSGHEFSASGQSFLFERDDQGAVAGFVLDAGRVRGLRFTKQED